VNCLLGFLAPEAKPRKLAPGRRGEIYAFPKSEFLLQLLFGSAPGELAFALRRVSILPVRPAKKFGEMKNRARCKSRPRNSLKTLKTAKEIFGKT
jgi:hypothetical protein